MTRRTSDYNQNEEIPLEIIFSVQLPFSGGNGAISVKIESKLTIDLYPPDVPQEFDSKWSAKLSLILMIQTVNDKELFLDVKQ